MPHLQHLWNVFHLLQGVCQRLHQVLGGDEEGYLGDKYQTDQIQPSELDYRMIQRGAETSV